MSVIRTILPMDASCVEWLDREEVSHPEPASIPRFPTPREISEVLNHLSGYAAKISANPATGEWPAEISSTMGNSAWAFLRVSNYRSDNEPHEFYFTNGWPEIVFTIVEKLTHNCGPLIVADDSGSSPIVVCPNDSIEDLLHRNKVA